MRKIEDVLKKRKREKEEGIKIRTQMEEKYKIHFLYITGWRSEKGFKDLVMVRFFLSGVFFFCQTRYLKSNSVSTQKKPRNQAFSKTTGFTRRSHLDWRTVQSFNPNNNYYFNHYSNIKNHYYFNHYSILLLITPIIIHNFSTSNHFLPLFYTTFLAKRPGKMGPNWESTTTKKKKKNPNYWPFLLDGFIYI